MSLEQEIPDPTGQPEMCSAQSFPGMMASYVADHAPRLFAVVQEFGTRVDARIAGWGMAKDDRYDVIGANGAVYLGAERPKDVLRFFHFRDRVTAHLVWHDPSAATPDDGEPG